MRVYSARQRRTVRLRSSGREEIISDSTSDIVGRVFFALYFGGRWGRYTFGDAPSVLDGEINLWSETAVGKSKKEIVSGEF